MNRRGFIRKIRSKPRRGRIRDKQYLAWIHEQPCLVYGKRAVNFVNPSNEFKGGTIAVTAHHVRRFGEPKNDYRTIPLLPQYHMHGYGVLTIEHGKKQFEERYGIDIEAEIVRLNAKYEAETGRQINSGQKSRFAQ